MTDANINTGPDTAPSPASAPGPSGDLVTGSDVVALAAEVERRSVLMDRLQSLAVWCLLILMTQLLWERGYGTVPTPLLLAAGGVLMAGQAFFAFIGMYGRLPAHRDTADIVRLLALAAALAVMTAIPHMQRPW